MALTAYVGVYVQMMYEKMIMSGHDLGKILLAPRPWEN